MKQTFFLNDNTRPTLIVVDQKSKKYECGLSIQISRVVNEDKFQIEDDKVIFCTKFIYEEINEDDFVVYARYIGEDNIRRNYPWFF